MNTRGQVGLLTTYPAVNLKTEEAQIINSIISPRRLTAQAEVSYDVPGLNLTAEQKTKIAEMRIAHMKDVKPLRDQMFIKRGDLRLLWQEQNPDQAKITAKQKEIRTLRDQIEDKSTNHRWAIYKELTPEQQEALKAYGPAGRCFGHGFGHREGGKHGPGSGRGPGPGPGPRGNY